MEERFRAVGHEHVSARHTSTVEVTTDSYLTPAGDCIIGIDADQAPADFAPEFVTACQNHDAEITLVVGSGGVEEKITGSGHPDLSFDSGRSVVARTSEYIDGRTVLIKGDGAAADLDRELIAALGEGASLEVILRVE